MLSSPPEDAGLLDGAANVQELLVVLTQVRLDCSRPCSQYPTVPSQTKGHR